VSPFVSATPSASASCASALVSPDESASASLPESASASAPESATVLSTIDESPESAGDVSVPVSVGPASAATHAPDAHVPGAQSVGEGATHVPAPLQLDAPTACVGSEHVAAAQGVDVEGYPHAVALVPSQLPAQAPLALPVHAARAPCGTPLVTVVQVPLLVERSHAWH
jgi:hypothetical protein